MKSILAIISLCFYCHIAWAGKTNQRSGSKRKRQKIIHNGRIGKKYQATIPSRDFDYRPQGETAQLMIYTEEVINRFFHRKSNRWVIRKKYSCILPKDESTKIYKSTEIHDNDVIDTETDDESANRYEYKTKSNEKFNKKIEEEDLCIIEQVLDERVNKRTGKQEVKVKWKGYNNRHNKWIEKSNIIKSDEC